MEMEGNCMIEIEKPKIECVEDPANGTYGKFTVEPLERGYGITLGNALRRIMLSSLPGTAATSIKIAGVQHEFSTIPGVKEDVTEIVLNVKSLITRLHNTDGIKTVYIEAVGPCEVKAGDIKGDSEVEVLNPSQVFLEERLDGATGSSIVVTMEGTRPILAEVQALVTPTMFGNAKRTTTGLDFNRASLIMAVLEKRAGLLLQNQDAYLKSAGGVKLDEPAIDLAVAVAIASSYKDKPTNPQECFVGELGLTGEVRRVNRIEQRINEAAKLGFTKIYVPKNSLTGISTPSGIEVVGVSTLSEVLKKVF
jgi:predicted ATP-dependent serine protease